MIEQLASDVPDRLALRNMSYYWRVRARTVNRVIEELGKLNYPITQLSNYPITQSQAGLPERFGQRCRVLVRGRMNSCPVEFEDRYRVVTSRHCVQRARA